MDKALVGAVYGVMDGVEYWKLSYDMEEILSSEKIIISSDQNHIKEELAIKYHINPNLDFIAQGIVGFEDNPYITEINWGHINPHLKQDKVFIIRKYPYVINFETLDELCEYAEEFRTIYLDQAQNKFLNMLKSLNLEKVGRIDYINDHISVGEYGFSLHYSKNKKIAHIKSLARSKSKVKKAPKDKKINSNLFTLQKILRNSIEQYLFGAQKSWSLKYSGKTILNYLNQTEDDNTAIYMQTVADALKLIKKTSCRDYRTPEFIEIISSIDLSKVNKDVSIPEDFKFELELELKELKEVACNN